MCNDCNKPVQTTTSRCLTYLESDCIYHKGSSLTTVIEELYKKIADPYDDCYTDNNYACLGTKYKIKTEKQFVEAISKEICALRQATGVGKDDYKFYFSNLSDKLDSVGNLKLISRCDSGFEPTETVASFAQKVVDSLCGITRTLVATTSPTLRVEGDSGILVTQSGELGHNMQLITKVSRKPANSIQLLEDGLYAAAGGGGGSAGAPLTFNATTGALSNGVNTVNIPLATQSRVTYTPNTRELCVDGSCVVLPAPILPVSYTFNDTSTIDFNISGSSVFASLVTDNNILTNVLKQGSGGAYVKVEDILQQISSNPTLSALLCGIVQGCTTNAKCFKFYLENNAVTPTEVNYTDRAGLTQKITLAANSTQTIIGNEITTSPSPTLRITNLGFVNCN